MVNNYKFNHAKYGTHKIIISLLDKNKKVLDIGCSSGYLGFFSKENEFYGIEIDKKSARKAQKIYKRVLIGDVEKLIKKKLPFPKFDIIVFADILEHLIDPKSILSYFVKNYLKKDGKVIISLPNVAHLTVRLNLLLGKFDYTESGILDKSHLHLYTISSSRKLIEDSGLKIIKTKFSSNRFGLIINKIKFLGPLLGFNLIFLCQKK